VISFESSIVYGIETNPASAFGIELGTDVRLGNDEINLNVRSMDYR
jgi:hypothetical protein